MKRYGMLLASTLLAAASAASAAEFKFAFQGDAHSMDPYTLNETFTLGFNGNLFEGLIRRAADLAIEPGLAEKWEVVEPTRWRFTLRRGVKFHDGREFTADDVVFSANRVLSETSDLKTRLATVKEVVKVDDYTVDFVTTVPNPILHYEWATWYMLSKAWAEEHNAVTPQKVTGDNENYATRHANGTGPFKLVSREVDVKTVAEKNDGWWDKPQHNLTKVTFTPIASDPTRVAALLSGEVDWIDPVPVQDQQRVDSDPKTKMLVGPELRTIYLGMDLHRDEALGSNVKGKNPFKDKRVREALYHAIDVTAINKKVMRGLSNPSAMMIGPGVAGFDPSIKRLAYDPDRSKALLKDAGYPDGFEIAMDCPNDRYVNDEAICQAVVSMFAKIGVKVNLLAQPKAQYFKKVLAPALDTSFYLIGWTPGSYDSWNPLFNLLNCQTDSGQGKFNLGRYCNPAVDKLTAELLSETDDAKRAELVKKAWQVTLDDVATLPLHQQALAWGMRENVDVKQKADNIFEWRFVNVK